MSLADELLADLEDDNDEEDELLEEIKKEPEPIEEDQTAGHQSGGEEEAIIMDVKDEPMEVDVKVASIREICKLRDSDRLKNVLTQIAHFVKNPRKTSEMIGNVESDPEYQLIVEANNIAVEIDNEICKFFSSVK